MEIVYTRSIMFPAEPEPAVLSIRPATDEVINLQTPGERFRNSLSEITPTVYVSLALLAVNILVFVAMTVSGVGLTPTNAGLLRWGADFGPRSTNGEWWRLLTSTFVHIGFLHIAFNMFALFQIGPLMERMLGNVSFAVVYFVCGLGGSIASLTIHPYSISAGASGAIFGLYGALIGFLTMRPKEIPEEVLAGLLKGALSVVGYNVIWGLFNTNIDMAGHVGGLLCGYACGVAMSLPITLEGAARRPRRLAAVGLAAALLLPAAALHIPRTVDPVVTLAKVSEVEKKAMAAYGQAFIQFSTKRITGASFADVLEKEILPPWNAQRRSLSGLVGLPAQQQRVIGILGQYMDARARAWTMLAAGLRENNQAKVRQGIAGQLEAVRYMRELGELTHVQSPGQKLPSTGAGAGDPQTITVHP